MMTLHCDFIIVSLVCLVFVFGVNVLIICVLIMVLLLVLIMLLVLKTKVLMLMTPRNMVNMVLMMVHDMSVMVVCHILLLIIQMIPQHMM
jgi:hypothetical protein